MLYWFRALRISFWIFAIILLNQCKSSSTKAPPPALNFQENAADAERDDDDEDSNTNEFTATELQQKAVARVLGFVDFDGKPISVYQDALSALHNDGAAPLFFHEPIFSIGSTTAAVRPDGKIIISIKNQYRPDSIRTKIFETLKETLKDLNIEVNRISTVPMDNLEASCLTIIGDKKPAIITKDFTSLTMEFDQSELPETLVDSILGGTFTTSSLIQTFSSCPVKYTFYIQRYDSQTCSIGVNESDISNMYLDSTGCDAPPNEVSATELAARNPAWAGIADTLNQVKNPVTKCLHGNEVSKLLRRSSVSCTQDAGAGGLNGLDQFIDGSIQQVLNVQPTSLDPNDWSKELAAATVKMFGDPNAFASELTNINNNILNKTSETLENEEYDRIRQFVDKIEEFGESNTKVDQEYQSEFSQDQKCKNGGGGGGFSAFGFGVSAGSSSGNCSGDASSNSEGEFRKRVDVLREYMRDTSLNDQENYIRNYLASEGLDSYVGNVNGQIRIFPKLNIYVRADKDKLADIASQFRNSTIGEIVNEEEEVTVVLDKPEELKLRVTFNCNGAAGVAIVDQPIREADWQKSETFWTSLELELNRIISEAASDCQLLTLSMGFVGVYGNEGQISEEVIPNIIMESDDPADPTSKRRFSQPFILNSTTRLDCDPPLCQPAEGGMRQVDTLTAPRVINRINILAQTL